MNPSILHFCTYFDHNYLPRGLALCRSLIRHCPQARLWVLCLSPECHDVLGRMNLPGIHRISMEEFETGDEPLRKAKTNRKKVEYYFTCTPSLPLYVMRQCPQAEMVTYLDSDLYFFGSPESVFDEIAAHSIAIIDHKFPPPLQERCRPTGKYNVGWVSFRRDEEGLACLQWWRERCLEWCHDYVDGDRFADQKYLEKWPGMFKNLVELQHKGANTAPYNLANYQVRLDGGRIWIDQDPLVVFHFHGFNQIASFLYDPYFHNYRVPMTKTLRQAICLPYVRAYRQAMAQVQPFLKGAAPRFKTRASSRRISWRRPHKFLYNDCLLLAERAKHLIAGDYVVCFSKE